MTSFRQREANRRNASKSTGPTTEQGKQRSRCNAVRHGLTAETVIGALEDADDYRAFEATIIDDYDARSAVERELVLRLASPLWRLRRAVTMETGLFEIQADHLNGLMSYNIVQPASRQLVYALFEPRAREVPASADPFAKRAVDFARCFLRLSNLPNYTLDRLSRYEATLWRQVAQTVVALDALDRRKPQERGGPITLAACRNCQMMTMTTADHNDDGLLFDPTLPNHRWPPYSRKFGFVSPNSFAHWAKTLSLPARTTAVSATARLGSA
jgi:hypothetical protein